MRNGFYREESEHKPLFRSRTAGLAVSLVLHALLVYGLFRARVTLKILTVGPEVKNVTLVPPVRITVPDPIDKYIQGPASEGPLGFESGRDGGRRPGRALQKDESPPDSGTGARKDSVLAPENLMKNAPGGEASPESGLSRDLALGQRYADREAGRYVINLSALPDKIEDAPLGFEDGPNGRYRPLQKYVQPPGRTRAGTRPPGSGGSGAQRPRARMEIRSPGYDISPWATKAIAIIQANWKIPEAVRILDKSEVRIAVTIEKNGTLSAFNRLASAGLDVLNAAASAALNSGSPLPPLPDDFPRPNLEAVFVFEYHE